MKKPYSSRARRIKIPTAESLANVALHYLGRYAASEASLRRVLQNRLRRNKLLNPEFANDSERQNQLHLAIEMIIERHKVSGALNDIAYTDAKVASLRRSGRSRRAIAAKLAHKGIKSEMTREAVLRNDMDSGHESEEEAELKAALALARRRRLGPFRTTSISSKPDDADRRRKDIAALARAGFSIDIARKALNWKEDNDPEF